MEITRIRIKDIVPYEGNAKQHPQKQIEQIKNSIREFSNRDPYPYTRRLTKAPQSWQYVEVEE